MFRDPRFIREFKAKHCVEVFATHAVNKTKSGIFLFTRMELIFLSFLGGNYGDARINQSLSIRTKSKWSMATAVISVVFNCFLTMFKMSLLIKLLCHLQWLCDLRQLTTHFFPRVTKLQLESGIPWDCLFFHSCYLNSSRYPNSGVSGKLKIIEVGTCQMNLITCRTIIHLP